MELTKTYSQTGKTMYHAIQLDKNTTIKAQSKVKAENILSSLKADSVVELIKEKRSWLLHIDGNCFGRLTKIDFTKLQNYLQEKNNENSQNGNQLNNITSSQNDQIPYQSQLSLFSRDGNSLGRKQEILPDRSELRYRAIEFIHKSSDVVFTSSQGLAYLNWVSDQIKSDESSGDTIIAGFASLERDCLTLATDQRQLGAEQRHLGAEQRHLGAEQRHTASSLLRTRSKYFKPDTIARLAQIANG
jgi:hypothetical protein